MNRNSVIGILFYLVAFSAAAKLPSSFLRCNRKQEDFNQCLAKAVENAVSQLTHPIKEVNLPNLNPLEIPSLVIGAGTSAVAFAQVYKNLKVYGFNQLNCSKIDMNFEKNTMTMVCSSPKIELIFDYEINGKILLLPIYGKGTGSIILENLDVVVTFQLEEYQKKGFKHYKIENTQFKMNPKLLKIKLDNLFDGDKDLGNNINQVLNDNWPEVFADVKTSYEEAFGRIFMSVFDRLLVKVSISELFGE